MTDGPSPPSSPPIPPRPEAELAALLRELFPDVGQLKWFLRQLPQDEGEHLEDHLPGDGASYAQVLAKAVELLQSRGWPKDLWFWEVLLRLRSGQRERIFACAGRYLKAVEEDQRRREPPLPHPDTGWEARLVKAIHDAFAGSERLGKRCAIVLHGVVGAGQERIVAAYVRRYEHLYQEVLWPEGSVEMALAIIQVRVAELRGQRDVPGKRLLFIVQHAPSLQAFLLGLPVGWYDVIVVSPDRVHYERSVEVGTLRLDEAKMFACAGQSFSEEEDRALGVVFRILGTSLIVVTLVREALRARTPTQLLEILGVMVDLGVYEELRAAECGRHPANCLDLVEFLRRQGRLLTDGWRGLVEAYRPVLHAKSPSALPHVVRALAHVAPGYPVPMALLVFLTQALESSDRACMRPGTRDDVLDACALLRPLGMIEWYQDHVVVVHAIQQAAIAEANGPEQHFKDAEAISEVMRGFCPEGGEQRIPWVTVDDIDSQSPELHLIHWVWSSLHPRWYRRSS